jgi:hypothetical protein
MTATKSVTPARPDRRERLVNVIPLVWSNIHTADPFTQRWMDRNNLKPSDQEAA